MHGVYTQAPRGDTSLPTRNVAMATYLDARWKWAFHYRPYLSRTLRRGGILPGEMQPIPLKRAATLIFILEVNFLLFFC